MFKDKSKAMKIEIIQVFKLNWQLTSLIAFSLSVLQSLLAVAENFDAHIAHTPHVTAVKCGTALLRGVDFIV